MPNIAYANGKWMPLASASVSVEDRGFQFGDGVYELIRTYHGAVFHLDEHIKRLYESLKQVEIALHKTPAELKQVVVSGVKRSGYAETKIYIQVTRGKAPRLHSFPKGVRPTLVMTFRKFDSLPKTLFEKGVSVISTNDIRWGLCNVKSLNLLPNILAREHAVRAGAYEAIFVRNDLVWEGAGSNLFAVFGKKIVTPPIGHYMLSGITREIVLALGRTSGLKVSEEKMTIASLYQADEIFLTGTTIEILPVIRLDKRKIGTGKPGTITSILHKDFQNTIVGQCRLG